MYTIDYVLFRPKLSLIIAKLKDAASTPADRDVCANEKTGVGKCKDRPILHRLEASYHPATCYKGGDVIAQLDVNSETSTFVSTRHQRIVHRLLCSAGDIVAC